MRQLLSDVAVLELAHDPSGSYCGKVFADLGADVVKVEAPAGDPERQHPERFVHLNTNKRAVLVADDDAGTRAHARAPRRRSTSSSRAQGAGDLHAFGLSRDEVREQFPSLVVATISGFGTTGPYADYTWSDLVAQTAAWVTFPQGRSLDIPVRSPRVAALCSVGHTAALGALSGRAPRPGVGHRRARRLRRVRGARQHPRPRVSLPRLGVRRSRPAAARRQRGRHAAAASASSRAPTATCR